ncbi:inositol-pentakisphosphate 2-kinase [Trametes gibbosa]|nr:inositol-pentakisphosphate 2-kinase [Trametes gibbosa]
MNEDLLKISETAPEHWKYISEGGSTIVFSYTGPPDARFRRTALRLRKCPVATREDPDGDAGLQTQEEPDDPTVVFQRTVIERLVPAAHLPQLRSVLVEREWLVRLAASAEPVRPLERRTKDRIDTSRRKAVLATDLVGGEGWAVEIKPKWGFLPQGAHLSPDTRATKTQTCRFCMHAHLKHAQGEGAVARAYCPLDLYAAAGSADDNDGADRRVRRALGALWDAWVGSAGAVNNLRVFIDGQMVKPCADRDALLADALAPLAARLLRPRAAPSAPDAVRAAFIATLAPVLQRPPPVLHTLARLQRTLDALDIEGLAALWARVRPADARALGAGMPDPDVAEWARFVDEHLARVAAAAAVTDTDTDAEGRARGLPATEAELRYRALAHLLGASFKDCSIMIRLAAAQDDDADAQEAGEGDGERATAGATVTVIDLDVKSVDRLPKWAALDRTIVDAYRAATEGAGESARRCVDAFYGEVPLP